MTFQLPSLSIQTRSVISSTGSVQLQVESNSGPQMLFTFCFNPVHESSFVLWFLNAIVLLKVTMHANCFVLLFVFFSRCISYSNYFRLFSLSFGHCFTNH